MAAAWQAMWPLRVTTSLAAGAPRDLTQSRKSRTCVVGSVPEISPVGIPASSAGLLAAILPKSAVSTQPSSPSKRTGQVPGTTQSPSPLKPARRMTNFTPLA